jgi:sugar O-acyltransferase (sialic acid O-acetyltransferase NeuD family)
MEKTKSLVILGDSAFAEIACEYFTHDSAYEVEAFAVESAYLKKDRLFGLPVVALEQLEQHYPPDRFEFFAAVVYTQLNRLRARLYATMKARGYRAASYVSPKAFVWPNAQLGEHCFIFEDNTIQPFVTLGNNVVLWSGNHIGHHSTIEDHVFIASHAVVSGFCRIGNSSFLGVNCTVSNNVSVGPDNWLGPGVVITHNTDADKLFKGLASEAVNVGARRFFKVVEG